MVPRRIGRDLVWESSFGIPVVLYSRALARHKTHKTYIAEERGLFVGEMWSSGEGEMMQGHCQKK